MKNYLFLSLTGTLITKDSLKNHMEKIAPDEKEKELQKVTAEPYFLPCAPEAITQLNNIIRSHQFNIVITDMKQYMVLAEVVQKLVDDGFAYPESIIGSTIDISMLRCGLKFHNLELTPLIMCSGDAIRHWIENWIEKPYMTNPALVEEYQYFEELPATEQTGLRVVKDGDEHKKVRKFRADKEGKDFQYLIVSDDNDILAKQMDNFIVTDYNHGLTAEVARKIAIRYA